MSRARRFQLLAALALLITVAVTVALVTAETPDEQPRFGDFNPPKNPVVASVDHGFDMPSEIRDETRRNQNATRRSYSEYVKVYDENETVSLRVPVQWNDVELDHAVPGDHRSGVKIMASTDLDSYLTNEAPGVTVTATAHSSPGDVLDLLDSQEGDASDACGNGRTARYEYVDPFFSGHYDFYGACSNGYSQIVLAATPGNDDVTILVEAVVLNEADLDAVTKVIESFQVLGEPGHDEHHEHEH